MSDDMMAIMGLSGFGKVQKKKTVGATVFEQTKRVAGVSLPANVLRSCFGANNLFRQQPLVLRRPQSLQSPFTTPLHRN